MCLQTRLQVQQGQSSSPINSAPVLSSFMPVCCGCQTTLASWHVDNHQVASSPRTSQLLWLVAKNPIFKQHLKTIACILIELFSHMECNEPGPGRRTYTDALNSAIGAVHSEGVGYGLRGAQDFQDIQLQALLVQICLQAKAWTPSQQAWLRDQSAACKVHCRPLALLYSS